MRAYYNEIDGYCAQWLRNLIAAGHIPSGDVDERSIVDVRQDDLRGYTQCHFFAGIGGWSLALGLAGWPDDRPVWTGSCPCQPFSCAGQGKATADERHLWPAWFSLIAQCRPPIIFGEQVEAAIGWGWLDLICTDLESQGYACGAAVLPACGVGAPHIRQRLWFVAHAEREATGGRRHDLGESARGSEGEASERERFRAEFISGVSVDRSSRSPWSDLEWILCADGKARPTKPGICPLAHGVSARVGKLGAAGNAIVPQVAAEFIAASIS